MCVNYWIIFGKGKKEKDNKEEANVVQEDSDSVVFMITTNEGKIVSDIWYLDTGCSNHMIENKNWLVDFDTRKRTSVKCANNKSMIAKGMGNTCYRGEMAKLT